MKSGIALSDIMPAMSESLDKSKLLEIVHFVTRKYAMEPEKLGLTKLHKILWYIEVRALRKFDRPLVHESFIRNHHGPFAQHLSSLLSDLQESNLLSVIEPTDDFEPLILIGKGSPKIQELSPEELSLVESVADWIVEDHTSSSISDKTHDEVWESIPMMESMPPMLSAISIVPTPPDIVDSILQERAG